MLMEYTIENKACKARMEYLIRKKFPQIQINHAGVVSWNGNDNYKKEQQKLLVTYISELMKLSDIELIKVYNEDKAKVKIERAAQEEITESGRFFNQKTADADYNYHGVRDKLTIEEFVALLLGKDPRIVTYQLMLNYKSTSSLFAKQYFELLQQVLDKFRPNPWYSMNDEDIYAIRAKKSTTDFINWAYVCGFDINPDWANVIKNKLIAVSKNTLTLSNTITTFCVPAV